MPLLRFCCLAVFAKKKKNSLPHLGFRILPSVSVTGLCQAPMYI